MTTLFISDLHLQDAEPALTRLFLDFMATTAPSAERLYVLGDLFEAWVGDDDDGELAQLVTGAFRAYTATGRQLAFLHGNRDFLLGAGFAARCGGELLSGPTVVALTGGSAVIAHGDELCTDDTAYQAFRAQVRNPAWQHAFLAKSLAERHQIAAGLRQASKAQTQEKAEYIMDVNADAVSGMLNDHGVTRLIHGHTHRPAFHRLPDGRERIVLGDWHQRGCYLRVDSQGAALTYFGDMAEV